jgi:hypothetical protein
MRWSQWLLIDRGFLGYDAGMNGEVHVCATSVRHGKAECGQREQMALLMRSREAPSHQGCLMSQQSRRMWKHLWSGVSAPKVRQ